MNGTGDGTADGPVDLAPRAALLAGLLGLTGVFVTVAVGGIGPLAAVALVGAGVLGAGVYYGQGLLSAGGLALVAVGAAVATSPTSSGKAVVIALGLGASVTLVVADASWWLRRQPLLDPGVGRGLLRSLVPVWVLGAVVGGLAGASSRLDQLSIWLLPAGIVAAAGLVALTAWATRKRHPRRDPLTDIRR